jgi:dTMP kinase
VSDTTIGRFIALEGGEGAGKSRLVSELAERQRARGREVVVVREPGGTPLGERVRELILSEREGVDPVAELLLFEAARAQLVASVIRPALERGAVVLCDRFSASSTAYQGLGRGLGREPVERANAIASHGVTPHLTLLLDVPVDVGLRRRAGDGDANRFDRETLAFHERVRAAYLDLAREGATTWRIIDASAPFERVLADATAAIDAAI